MSPAVGVREALGGPRERRVVVTGMGVVTSLGSDLAQVWDAVTAGRSGVGKINSFESRYLPIRIASEVDADAVPLADGEWRGQEEIPRVHLSRAALFGVSALQRAWADAGIAAGTLDPDRLGVYVGASSFPAFEQNVASQLSIVRGNRCDPIACLELFRRQPHILAQRSIPFIGTLLAREVDARGPCVTVHTACSSSSQALGEAFHAVRSGRADVIVSGGADSMLSLFCLAGFTLLGTLSRCEDPARASRPFDARRDGFVLGEGAGIVILEELEHALRRGARIHGEMLGYGSSSDGYRITDVHPAGDGALASMQGALASARISPHQVDYINAHGTSTTQNDRVESLAIKRAFGAHAYHLAVSSTKSELGHLVCAAGGLEFILTVMTLKTGVLPPTINLETPDPDCDLDYVPNTARRTNARVALSNSFGFGGQNGTVVVRRWDDPERS
jgi:3-oxoacyl-[acyl-carrier-protein] synthase II